jgi:hypothetical protein
MKREIGQQKAMTTEQVIEVLDFCMKSSVKIREVTFLNA